MRYTSQIFFKTMSYCLFCKTKSHTAYFACERCVVRGERFQGRTIFPFGNYNKRTDKSFRMQEQPEHYTGVSSLLQINPPIDMIHHFVLDFMHLCCIGIMKKLLKFWPEDSAFKLNYRQKQILTDRSIKMSQQVPCEYQQNIIKIISKIFF